VFAELHASDPMLPIEHIILGIVAPVLISAAVLMAAWRPWRERERARGGWGPPVAVGLGVLAAFIGLFGLPPLPPVESWQWLFYLTLAAALLGVADALVAAPLAVRRGLMWIPLAIAPWLLVRLLLPLEWSPGATYGFIAALAVANIIIWTAIDVLALRAGRFTLLLVLTILVSAASKVVLDSANAKLAQLAGALAATLGPAMVLALWRDRGINPPAGGTRTAATALSGRATLTITLPFTGVLMSAYVNNYGDVPAASFVLLAAAPVAMALAEFAPLHRLRPWQALLTRLSVAALPMLVALVLSMQAAAAMEEYD